MPRDRLQTRKPTLPERIASGDATADAELTAFIATPARHFGANYSWSSGDIATVVSRARAAIASQISELAAEEQRSSGSFLRRVQQTFLAEAVAHWQAACHRNPASPHPDRLPVAARLAYWDPVAWAEVHSYLLPMVQAYGRNWKWTEQDVADVTGPTIEKLIDLVRSGDYQERGYFWSFARTVCLRIAKDHKRGRTNNQRKNCTNYHAALGFALAREQHAGKSSATRHLMALDDLRHSGEPLETQYSTGGNLDRELDQIVRDAALDERTHEAARTFQRGLNVLRAISREVPIENELPLTSPETIERTHQRIEITKAMEQVKNDPSLNKGVRKRIMAALGSPRADWDQALNDLVDYLNAKGEKCQKQLSDCRKRQVRDRWRWMEAT